MTRKEFFESVAWKWEEEHQEPESQQKLSELVKTFNLKPGEKILDAGCGTGRLVPYLLAAVGPSGMVVAVDFAAQMIEIARKKYSASNLIFLQADVLQLPLPDNFFDRIISLALFPHLPEKDKALREFYRLLQPGGELYIVHTASREEINHYHAQLVYPLCQDFLPENEEMRKLIAAAKFDLLELVDEADLYLVRCRKNE